MSDQQDVQHYLDREAEERARAERTADPAMRASILQLADAYAAVAGTQKALVDFNQQKQGATARGWRVGASQ